MLAEAQARVSLVFSVLVAGSPYTQATFLSVDTDKAVIQVDVPEMPVPTLVAGDAA